MEHGPDNPHPFSQMSTELIWEGKYDAWGKRRAMGLEGCVFPIDKKETTGSELSDGLHNQLYWGDNKQVMASLLAAYQGKVGFIYLDPPFDVGVDFSVQVPIGSTGDKPNSLQVKTYRDRWGRGTDSYLHFLYERLWLMKELLSEDGNLFVHVDYRASGSVRLLLDEIFESNLMNEIIWAYNSGPRSKNAFGRRHDTIFRYAKNPEKAYMNLDAEQVREPYSPDINVPASKAHYYDARGKVKGDVFDIKILGQNDKRERTGYSTQKPEALLEVLVAACSRPDDLVADFFCGSGTTGVVAELLGRPWIMADVGTLAVHTARKRLSALQEQLQGEDRPYRNFDLYRLGDSDGAIALKEAQDSRLEAALVHDPAKAERAVDVRLIQFVPSLNEVPEKMRASIQGRALDEGFDFLDFWALDFDWKPGRVFRHHWQDYRSRSDRSLKLQSDAGHVYGKSGTYTIGLKAIDLFGCETMTTVEVTIE
jgi:adenine-specific DNA-methyltransferase